jgi:NitT/TauT family transport system substrate-binding protein
MKQLKLVSIGIVGALLSVTLISGCGKQESQTKAQLEKFSLKLHWIPDTHQIGFWTAVDKGFYRDAGLDMTVLPGGLDANPIKDVLSGSADVGQVGGIEQVCSAVAEGLPVQAIASIHRETPHALISLSTKPIQDAKSIVGKTIAVAYGDTAEILLKAYLKQVGVQESAVKLVPFRFDLTALVNGQVDAVTGFSTGQPATLERLGKTPVVLRYSASGISSYGYTLFATNDAISKRPDSYKRFLAASRRGWEYAFSHPDESIGLFKKRFRDVDEKLATRELVLIRPLMMNPSNSLSTWKLDEDRVKGVISFLTAQGQLKKEVSAKSVFNNSLSE